MTWFIFLSGVFTGVFIGFGIVAFTDAVVNRSRRHGR